MPSSPLAGQVAIVTGATRGIGKGCALELGAAGATVYLTGRSVKPEDSPLPGTLGQTVDEITAAGGEAVGVRCDHRNDDEVAALFTRVLDERGQLDVLVNCACSIPAELVSKKPFWELPISNWDDLIDVGTRSAYVTSHHAAKIMVPRQHGLIVNISSSGAVEYAWHVAYGVGKAALDRLTADTAHELASAKVAVVSLWPGLVRTERVELARAAGLALDLEGAESQRFTGRAVVALASDPEVLARSGKAFSSRELADAYGFTDIDGSLPAGPLDHREALVPER